MRNYKYVTCYRVLSALPLLRPKFKHMFKIELKVDVGSCTVVDNICNSDCVKIA